MKSLPRIKDPLLDKLRVALPPLMKRELGNMIEEIETCIIEYFADNPNHAIYSLGAWWDAYDHTAFEHISKMVAVHPIFKEQPGYFKWLHNYVKLSRTNVEFRKKWMTEQIGEYLQVIRDAWNDQHTEYVMSWQEKFPYSLKIEKK